jgi:hypothetical protein
VIVVVAVTNQGGDGGLMTPMVAQIRRRYGLIPADWLADGGFSTKVDITAVSEQEITVHTPVKDADKKFTNGIDPYQARAGDTPALAAWRRRMGEEGSKRIYHERAATIECVNAHSRQRNLWEFRTRGLAKVRAVALWRAVARNVPRGLRLRSKQKMAASAWGLSPGRCRSPRGEIRAGLGSALASRSIISDDPRETTVGPRQNLAVVPPRWQAR